LGSINNRSGAAQFGEVNRKAKDLHLENTNFENPSGVDSPNHFSTPRDMSLLTAVATKNQVISKIVATARIDIHDVSGKRTYKLKNVNQLLGKVSGVDGVKTGFTNEAGQCLITSASRNGHRVVIVIMGSLDRFGESAKLVEWTFNNFQWVSPLELLNNSSSPSN
jgi:D-alanyl-D-alanine carboxypeptidase (penicillin-binding protein 5/6)